MGSQAIASELTKWITSGHTAVGSFLPPTRDLAMQFGVSLHTVGVALRQLEMQKLVECRPRQRAIVRSCTPAKTTEPQLKQVVLYVNNLHDWTQAVHGTMHSGDWGACISQHIEQELFAAGFSMIAMSPPGSEGPTLRQRLDRLGRTLQGAITFARDYTLPIIEEMDRRGLPWLAINRPSQRMDYNYVAADNMAAGWSAGRLFAASGFTRVLLLASDLTSGFSDLEKVTGVFRAFLESGVSVEGIRTLTVGNIHEMSGYRAVRDVLAGGFRPQAVFTSGDLLAMGAIRALADAGLRVPEDVGVLGATGMETSADFDPPLSVIAQPMREMGETAGKVLVEMIREGTRRYAPRRIACPIILRKSMILSDSARQALAANPDRDPLQLSRQAQAANERRPL